jgi:hypothetical protein
LGIPKGLSIVDAQPLPAAKPQLSFVVFQDAQGYIGGQSILGGKLLEPLPIIPVNAKTLGGKSLVIGLLFNTGSFVTFGNGQQNPTYIKKMHQALQNCPA